MSVDSFITGTEVVPSSKSGSTRPADKGATAGSNAYTREFAIVLLYELEQVRARRAAVLDQKSEPPKQIADPTVEELRRKLTGWICSGWPFLVAVFAAEHSIWEYFRRWLAWVF